MPARTPAWIPALLTFVLALIALQTEAANPAARKRVHSNSGLRSRTNFQAPGSVPARRSAAFGTASAPGGGGGSGGLVAWGSSLQGQTSVPADLWGVKAAAAGGTHSLALRTDGTVAGWGDNTAGQATPPPGLTMVKAIAAGGAHSLALRANGTVMAWGDNSAGQAAVPPGLNNVMAIAAGGRHSLALLANGSVVGWGDNGEGQAAVPGDLSGVIAIAAGRTHSLALKADGTLAAWGRNDEGQCTIPPNAVNVKAIAAGGHHCLAVKTDGSVVAWGSNSDGQTSVPADALGVIDVAAGDGHSVALKADGTVLAWGLAAEGQITLPVSLDFVGSIAAGGTHTLALRCTSSVVAWGSTVGNGAYLNIWSTGITQIKALAGGGLQSLALRADGRVIYQGLQSNGNSPGWEPPLWLEGVTAIASGLDHHQAVLQDGQIAAWGLTNAGQTSVIQSLAGYREAAAGDTRGFGITGEGVVVSWGVRAAPPPLPQPVRMLDAGYDHGIALLADGTVRTWGRVTAGNVTPPVGLGNVIAVAAGQDHLMALQADGTVVAWGRNNTGQTDTVGLNQVIGIDAGRYHGAAIRADGTSVAWGGESTSIRSLPNAVAGYSTIASGLVHSFAVVASAPPAINAIPDQFMLEDQDELIVPFVLSDSDDPTASLGVNYPSRVSGLLQSITTGGSGANRHLRIVPVSQAYGSTPITVSVSDGQSAVSETFQLTILAVNDRPTFNVGSNQTVAEDSGPQVVSGWATGRSTGNANEFDQALTFQVVSNSNPGLFSEGPTVNGATGALTYTPAPNAFGNATIALVLKDDGGTANGGSDTSAVRTFTITVTPVADPVVAADQTMSTPEDTAGPVTLPTVDQDGTSVSVEVLTQPLHGTLSGTGANRTYTPNPDYYGPDHFTFRLNRGGVYSNSATVQITVTPRNDAPSALGQDVQGNEDASRQITLQGSDIDGDPLTYQITTEPTHGVLQGSGADRIYVPDPDFSGTDSFVFRVNDGTAASATAVVTLHVLPSNDAPVARGQSLTVVKGGTLDLTLEGSDLDGDPLTFFLVTGPSHGVLTGTGANRVYTPTPGYVGADSLTYLAHDGRLDSSPATVSLTVMDGNAAPVAFSFSVTTAEDLALPIDLQGFDAEGDALTYFILVGPTHGTLSGTGPQRFYTPAPHFHGTDTFQYQVSDGTAMSTAGTVTVVVTPRNDAPVAYGQAVRTAEETSLAITLSGEDLDGDPLTYQIVSAPANGLLSGSGAQRTYTPSLDFRGGDSFTFRVSDGAAFSSTVTVTIDVTPRNDPPTARDQNLTGLEDTPLALTLGATDIDGDPLTYFLVAGPAHGTLSGSGSSRTYTPAPDYHGPDSFTFRVHDGTADSNLATVSVTVLPRNDTPTTRGQAVATPEDTPLSITLGGLDADGDPFTYQLTALPAHGTLSGSGADRTYTPDPNYHGTDSFSFLVSDGSSDSAPATVTITVAPRNDAPTGSAASFTTAEDTALAVTLTGTDVDGDSLTYEVVSLPTHGTLSGSGASRTYTPDPHYHGADSFTYRVSDGTAASGEVTVALTVTSVPDAPAAAADSGYSTPYATPLSVPAPGVLANDTDADGDALSVVLVSGPTHGTLTLSADGSFTYTPSVGYSGTDTFTYRALDGTLSSPAIGVSLTVGSAPPSSTARGRVTGSGKVTLKGKTANIKVNLTVAAKGRPSGTLSLAVPRGTTYKSTSITAIVLTGNRARIFGRATGPNRTTVDFVVEIEDNGKSAGQDRFRLDASDGFSSGSLALSAGNLTISQK